MLDKILIGVIILAGVVMLAVCATYQIKYSLKKVDVDFKKQQIANMEIAEKVEAQYHEAIDSYNTVKAFVDTTHSDNVVLLTFMKDLEKLLPTGTSINNLKCYNGYVEFDVYTTSKEAVADMIVNMNSIDYVSNVYVPSFKEEYLGEPEEEEEDNDEEEIPTLVGEEYIRTPYLISYHFSCAITDLNYVSGTESIVTDPSAETNEGGEQ